MTPGTPNAGQEDEIIPTAIVIKNIPFNVKRETLLDIIVRIFFPRLLRHAQPVDTYAYVQIRPHSRFRRRTPSIITWISPGSSEDSPSPTSARRPTRMLSSLL